MIIEPNTVAAVAMTIIAVLQVLLAALSLKVGPNSLLGLRLPWTMKNMKIWHASQQIGFITAVTTSIGILVVAWTIKDNPLLIILLGVGMIVANTIFISIQTYVLSKKDEYKE
ncbi:SdpI family protein [Thermicanus aegyptius]|uniref:SdpI family protein n=1 Tax=Thermicanus aegyptius TaxID=94009 RepID=UPI00048CD571|nr:SdpI family protein [Thermicanus aegyptius]